MKSFVSYQAYRIAPEQDVVSFVRDKLKIKNASVYILSKHSRAMKNRLDHIRVTRSLERKIGPKEIVNVCIFDEYILILGEIDSLSSWVLRSGLADYFGIIDTNDEVRGIQSLNEYLLYILSKRFDLDSRVEKLLAEVHGCFRIRWDWPLDQIEIFVRGGRCN